MIFEKVFKLLRPHSKPIAIGYTTAGLIFTGTGIVGSPFFTIGLFAILGTYLAFTFSVGNAIINNYLENNIKKEETQNKQSFVANDDKEKNFTFNRKDKSEEPSTIVR